MKLLRWRLKSSTVSALDHLIPRRSKDLSSPLALRSYTPIAATESVSVTILALSHLQAPPCAVLWYKA